MAANQPRQAGADFGASAKSDVVLIYVRPPQGRYRWQGQTVTDRWLLRNLFNLKGELRCLQIRTSSRARCLALEI